MKEEPPQRSRILIPIEVLSLTWQEIARWLSILAKKDSEDELKGYSEQLRERFKKENHIEDDK